MENQFACYDLQALPVAPRARQMEWYRREKTAFFHFTVNTFTDLEWGDGTEKEEIFNPTQVDCRQWIKAIADAGFTTAILTAKHHDGFCLWPCAYTEHTIKNSPYKNGKGDLVKEFTDACREYGIKAGLYLSPWDRNCPYWGTDAYNDLYANQLTELMTHYGKIWECWWDGAGSTKAVYDWQRWANIVRTNQPDCVIFGSLGAAEYVDVRWVGNERGVAGEPCFATVDTEAVAKEIRQIQNTGDPDGNVFMPAECDTSIRPGWFYHESQDDQVKTPAQLVDYWFTSIGKNCGILLNIPPDRRGLLKEHDVEVLQEWKARLDRAFAENLAQGAMVTASSAREGCPAEHLLSAEPDAIYAPVDEDRTPVITLRFAQPVTFNCYRLEEVIELGHTVREFSVEALVNGQWVTVARHESIGYCRCEHFDAVTADAVRVHILRSACTPSLRAFKLYCIPQDVFAEDAETVKKDLTRLPAAKVSYENAAVTVNLGGIYPYDTVELTAPLVQSCEIQAFNGTQYETVAILQDRDAHTVTKFNKIEDSYQLRIVATEGSFAGDVEIKVRLS